MNESETRIEIIGLAARFHAPAPASPRTRDKVPSGYGTREQCRPFAAAAGLGLMIPSPFSWGFCTPGELPTGARAFRSPVAGGCAERCFYVIDDPGRGFTRNQFHVPEAVSRIAGALVIPGLSFFDRTDQQAMVKLHLPYVFRTPDQLGLLFVPPLNRPCPSGLNMLSGLVETNWYADAVDLVFELPAMPHQVHIAAGQPLAQAFPVPLAATRPELTRLELHKRKTRDTLAAVADWKVLHGEDRSAYKRLSKQRIKADPAN